MSIQSDIQAAKIRERIADSLERKSKKLRDKTARSRVKISTRAFRTRTKSGPASRNKGSWTKTKKAPILLMKIGKSGSGGISYSMKQENAALLETNLFGWLYAVSCGT